MKNCIYLLFFILSSFLASAQVIMEPDGLIIGANQYPTAFSTDTVFYWNKNTLSFRAGIFSDGIAKPSIGAKYSVAWGENNEIGGQFSMGWGSNNSTSEKYSTVWGDENTASGIGGTAWGGENIAAGGGATVWGGENRSLGDYATVWGIANKADSLVATAWGSLNSATNYNATAWGKQNKAKGITSTAWGHNNKVTGQLATTWGKNNLTYGKNATVLGEGNGTYYKSAVVIGEFNEFVDQGEPIFLPGGGFDGETPNTDLYHLFVIGNGSNSSNRSNAVTVTRQGYMGIGTSTPEEAIHIANEAAIQFGETAEIRATGDNLLFNTTLIPAAISQNLGTSTKRWGRVYTVAGVVTTSDIRLKENVRHITNGLDIITQITPIRYNLISTPEEQHLGFSAQELETIVPEVVYKEASGCESNDSTYGVNYAELIPVLTKAIQEQQHLIEQMGEELQLLKKKMGF